jgi:uncharacterized phage-associated protein
MTTTANRVADFFLWFAQEHGDCLTNLKLQKLAYYAQAWFLALHGEPLFTGKFQAWVHGPVYPPLYRRFKSFGYCPITECVEKPSLESKVEKHLEKIFSVFGRYSAWDLERMTHREQPWIKARGALPIDEECTREISETEMRNFYASLRR